MNEFGCTSQAERYAGAFFLHIPKTAGSSLCDMFCFSFDHFVRDAHVDGSNWRDIVAGEETFFVSGHFRFPQVVEFATRPDVFSFTVLREPIEHLVSHLNWVKAYGDPARSDKLSEIPSLFAEQAVKLWEVSLDDVDALEGIIGAPWPRLFHDAQVKFLAGGPLGDSLHQNVDLALATLERLDFYFVLEDIEPAIDLLNLKLGPLEPLKMTNQNLLTETPNFENETVRAFYHGLVAQDLELYEAAKSASRARFGL